MKFSWALQCSNFSHSSKCFTTQMINEKLIATICVWNTKRKNSIEKAHYTDPKEFNGTTWHWETEIIQIFLND